MILDFARDCPRSSRCALWAQFGIGGSALYKNPPHLGHNRPRAPFHKLRIAPQLLQPARRGRLPILKSKRQNLRRPRQGFFQSVGGGDDAGEIGEGDAPAGDGGFVDEGDLEAG
jgi:hypothetical protein